MKWESWIISCPAVPLNREKLCLPHLPSTLASCKAPPQNRCNPSLYAKLLLPSFWELLAWTLTWGFASCRLNSMNQNMEESGFCHSRKGFAKVSRHGHLEDAASVIFSVCWVGSFGHCTSSPDRKTYGPCEWLNAEHIEWKNCDKCNVKCIHKILQTRDVRVPPVTPGSGGKASSRSLQLDWMTHNSQRCSSYWEFLLLMREVLGATVRSLGALLGFIFVAVRDVLRWLVFWIEEDCHVKMKLRLWYAADVILPAISACLPCIPFHVACV